MGSDRILPALHSHGAGRRTGTRRAGVPPLRCGAAGPAPRSAVAAAFEPVIRLLGTGCVGVQVAEQLVRLGGVPLHRVTGRGRASSALAMGTVVVAGLRSANATWTSWYRCVPLSTVSEPAAPNAAGNAGERVEQGGRAGHLAAAGPCMNSRWFCSRCRSWSANCAGSARSRGPARRPASGSPPSGAGRRPGRGSGRAGTSGPRRPRRRRSPARRSRSPCSGRSAGPVAFCTVLASSFGPPNE